MLTASKLGDIAAVNGLIKSGGNINEKNKEGKTPLIIAVYNNRAAIVTALLGNGVRLMHKTIAD